jgi:hypothetical protein
VAAETLERVLEQTGAATQCAGFFFRDLMLEGVDEYLAHSSTPSVSVAGA